MQWDDSDSLSSDTDLVTDMDGEEMQPLTLSVFSSNASRGLVSDATDAKETNMLLSLNKTLERNINTCIFKHIRNRNIL